jgi:ABC-type sugar transport system ATPase subunit
MGGTRLPLDLAAGHDNYRSLDGKQVIVGIRPGDLTPAQDNGPAIAARVEIVERLGGENMVVFPVATPQVRADQFGQAAAHADDNIATRPADESAFTAKLDGGLRPQAGDVLRLAIRPGALYLFDADTGDAI